LGFGFNEVGDDGVEVASAEWHANHLHITPDRKPRPHINTSTLILYMLHALCSSWRPVNSAKALKTNSSRLLESLQYNNTKIYNAHM